MRQRSSRGPVTRVAGSKLEVPRGRGRGTSAYGDIGQMAPNQPQMLEPGTRLDVWNESVSPVVLTFVARNGSTGSGGQNAVLQAGEVKYISGDVMTSVTAGAGSLGVLYAYVLKDDPETWGPGSPSVQGYTSLLIEVESVAPVATGLEAETVLNAGSQVIPLSSRVHYNLSMASGSLANDATLSYIALKGASTGNYYAVSFLGNVSTGEFHMPVTGGEKLNVVAAVTFAGGQPMSAYWMADRPAGGA